MTTEGVKIPLRDQLWLHMDRPGNLMYINSIMWFSEVPDWERVLVTLEERMVERYPVFSRVPVREGRTWFWRDDPDFDMAHHVSHHRLGGSGDRAAAEAHISARVSEPMPEGRPLWQAEFIDGYHGHGGDHEGALLLFRVQHGLVDGVRLTQLILSLCDHDEDSVPTSVGRGLVPELTGLVGTVGHAGAEIVRDSFDIARGVAGATLVWPWTLTRLARDVAAPGRGVTRIPTRLVESLSEMVDPTNTVANTFRAVARLVLEPRTPELTWTGHTGAAKKVGWLSDIDLGAVRRVARAHDSTITAMILASVSMGLTEYLREHGDRQITDLNLLVPVSLAPIDVEPDAELGNQISLVLMRLPLWIDEPGPLLAEITEMMTRARHSLEPHVTFALMLGVAAAPRPVSGAIVEFFANKTFGQLTSVPGPRTQVHLAGSPVAGMLGWVPMSGNQALGISIFSYNGGVSIGVATDAELIPDPTRMVALVGEQFEKFDGWADED